MGPEKILNLVACRLNMRSNEIREMAKTGYSFEEWINWEIFLALQSDESITIIHPKPNYRARDLASSPRAADLLIMGEMGPSVVIEIALVHDETNAKKWQMKVDDDKRKLAMVCKSEVTKLQIIIIVSVKDRVSSDEYWKGWLEKTDIYTTNLPSFKSISMLPQCGQIGIFGWVS